MIRILSWLSLRLWAWKLAQRWPWIRDQLVLGHVYYLVNNHPESIPALKAMFNAKARGESARQALERLALLRGTRR